VCERQKRGKISAPQEGHDTGIDTFLALSADHFIYINHFGQHGPENGVADTCTQFQEEGKDEYEGIRFSGVSSKKAARVTIQ